LLSQKLSDSCAFCAGAHRDKIISRLNFHSSAAHAARKNFHPLAQSCSQLCSASLQIDSAPRIKHLVLIMHCFSTHWTLHRPNGSAEHWLMHQSSVPMKLSSLALHLQPTQWTKFAALAHPRDPCKLSAGQLNDLRTRPMHVALRTAIHG